MIYLAIPSARDWKGQATISLASAMCHTTVKDKISFCIQNRLQVSLLSSGRESLVEDALEQEGVTHLIFIDDDISYPHDSFSRLIAHDVDVVGIDYRKKCNEEVRVSMNYDGKKFAPKEGGLHKASAMGLGLVCFKIDVFKKVLAPRFEVRWHEAINKYVSEDIYLFNKLRKNDIDVYCDLDLSKECAHIGDAQYIIGRGAKNA